MWDALRLAVSGRGGRVHRRAIGPGGAHDAGERAAVANAGAILRNAGCAHQVRPVMA